MKKSLVLLTVIATTGCATLQQGDVARDPLSHPLGEAVNLMPDEACGYALKVAENNNHTPDNARLYGIWRSWTGECEVYNIASLEKFGPYVSPIEALEMRLDQSKANGEIKDYDFSLDKPYVRLWD